MKSLALALATSVVTIAVLEGLCFLAARFVIPRDWVYRPPSVEQFEQFLAEADPRLGWLPPKEVAPGGHRITPAAAEMAMPCVSVYGDSYAWGAEVSNEEAWGNVLTSLLGCRVDNYGVIGYGSDQAFLRFRYNQEDPAPVVVITHLSENIARNVNQDFGMLYSIGISVHPIFVRGETGIQLVAMPALTSEDHALYVRNPGHFLRHEYFLADATPFSHRTLGFPYLLRFPRVVLCRRILLSARLELFGGPPWYAELYEPGHESGALDVTEAVLASFAQEARARGRAPVVILLPSGRVLQHFQRSGDWVHANLERRLVERDVPVYDAGPGLLEELGNQPLCDLYCSRPADVSGHYTAAGNHALARVAARILEAEGLSRRLPPAR